MTVTLADLQPGEAVVIENMELPASEQGLLMRFGFFIGAEVRCSRRAPLGDPVVYSLDGSEIALRAETRVSDFRVALGPKGNPRDRLNQLLPIIDRSTSGPRQRIRTGALIGPPNSGKTTLFNRLTNPRRFFVEQQNLTQRDLIPQFGSESAVSMFMTGQRNLTVEQVRRLSARFKLPADVFIPKVSGTHSPK